MNNPSKKTNTVFLITVIVYLAASVLLSMLSARSINVGMEFSLIFGELIVVIPGLIFLLLYRCDLSEWIPIRKVKAGTIGYTILLTFLIMPFLYLLNTISQLFVKNAAIDLMNSISDISMIVVVLIVGLFGPLCEEITFRGIFFSGFKRSGRVFLAVIWSGLLFGLFHMNLNQLGYAFAIGIISAFLVEATGSLVPSLIMHLFINSYNVLQLYVVDFAAGMLGESVSEIASSEELITKDALLRASATFLIPAIIGMAIAVVVFIAIINKENRMEYFLSILPRKNKISDNSNTGDDTETKNPKKDHVITFSGILGVAICIFMIFAIDYLADLAEKIM